MAKRSSKVSFNDWLQTGVLRITRVHFFYVAALALQVIIYHAWKVLTLEVISRRWIGVAVLLTIVTIVWLIAHNRGKSAEYYKRLVYVLVAADIAIASLGVYLDRGMASRAVFLYAIPIIVSAILLSRVAIFATAVFSIAAYVTTAVVYFENYFNEGYTAELYAEVGFYSAGFLLLAALLSIVVHFKND